MHTLKKEKKKTINQTNVCGQVGFHFFFSFLQCLYVFFFYLVSHFCTVTLESQLISLSSNVDFLVIRIKFVIKCIKYDSVSSTEVSEKIGKKINR